MNNRKIEIERSSNHGSSRGSISNESTLDETKYLSLEEIKINSLKRDLLGQIYKLNKEYYDNNLEEWIEISDNFSGKFWNSGVMRNGRFYTIETKPNFDGNPIHLKDILQQESDVPEE